MRFYVFPEVMRTGQFSVKQVEERNMEKRKKNAGNPKIKMKCGFVIG